MKKFTFAILSLVLVASFVSCGKPVQETPEITTESPTTTVNETRKENHSEVFTTEETDNNFLTTEKLTVADSTEENPDSFTHATANNTTRPGTSEPKTVKAETTTKVTTTSPKNEIHITYHPEKEIVELHNTINKYRQENGLSSLTLDPELCELAYRRAVEQNTSSGHTRPDGTPFYTIADENNYNYSVIGENICYLFNYPVSEAFVRWKNSPGHNENMLSTEWTKTGLALHVNESGEYRIVQLFAG